MDITGAIFDCDGTLLDSMPMWNEVFPRWLESHGVADARAVADRYEHMNFYDECIFFHDEYGIGQTGEEAFSEVKAQVAAAYAAQVQPFAGCRDFLEALARAGVPCIIASSTTVDLVRDALASHGLVDYFCDIIYTGEVGADKQHPDIYEEALRRLGTAQETTWVFEDAPFGVRTAHTAGFPTVCLMNDHDGRDEDFLRDNCDILVHGYPELSLALLRDYARPAAVRPDAPPFRALIVDGSPEASSAYLVARLAAETDYLIAADRGAAVCRKAGLAPQVFCGDADSAAPETAAWAADHAQTNLRFPSDKYATDLALAVACARHEAARRKAPLALTVTCASGGRPDQALAVLGLLAEHADASPRLVEDAPVAFECRLLSPEGAAAWDLPASARGKTLSVVAVAPQTEVSETGMRWELDHAALGLLSDRGISNLVEGPGARIVCHGGAVACFLLEDPS